MLNRCYIKLSLVNILENVFVFIEILFKMLLFKGGVLIYAEHCIYIYTQNNVCHWLGYELLQYLAVKNYAFCVLLERKLKGSACT